VESPSKSLNTSNANTNQATEIRSNRKTKPSPRRIYIPRQLNLENGSQRQILAIGHTTQSAYITWNVTTTLLNAALTLRVWKAQAERSAIQTSQQHHRYDQFTV